MSKKYIIGIVILAVLVVVGWIFFAPQGGKDSNEIIPSSPITTDMPQSTLGGSIYEGVTKNPAENIPDVNPLQRETNPLDGAYKNPFE